MGALPRSTSSDGTRSEAKPARMCAAMLALGSLD